MPPPNPTPKPHPHVGIIDVRKFEIAKEWVTSSGMMSVLIVMKVSHYFRQILLGTTMRPIISYKVYK
jgi:hypothetical protein